MDHIEIQIDVEPFLFQTKAPKIKIWHNNLLLDDCEIMTSRRLSYRVSPEKNNRIEICFYNKSFGENNQWDTNDSEDLKIKIHDIKLNSVSIDHLITDLVTTTNWSENQLKYESQDTINKFTKYCSNGFLTFNGCLTFEYSIPIYEYLIEKKFRNVQLNSNMSYFSVDSEKFNYDKGLEILSKIKTLLDERK